MSINLDPALRLVGKPDYPFETKWRIPLEGCLHGLLERILKIRVDNLIKEGLTVDWAAFARSSEDLVHAVVFPTGPIISEVPHKDSELRNLSGELQPGFAVAKFSSSCNNLSHIAVRI